MKRWTDERWTKLVAAGLAWVFSMSQAMPLAYAQGYLREAPTVASPVAGAMLGDPAAFGAGVAKFLGRPNLNSGGYQLVEPARREGRLMYLTGSHLAAQPIDQQVEAYAANFQARYGIAMTARPGCGNSCASSQRL